LKAGCTSNLLMYTRPYLRIWLPIHALILWKVCQCVLLIRIWCMNRVVSGGVTVLQLLRGLSLSLSPLISFILCGIYLSSIRILSCIYDFVNVFRYKNHPFASLIFIFEKQITGYLVFHSSWHVEYFGAVMNLTWYAYPYLIYLI
jgi:hypothetical protein